MTTKKVESKPTITKVVLNVHGKEVSLSLDEAKDLKKTLNELFGEEKTNWIPYYPYYPYQPWVTPHWTYQYTWGNSTNNPPGTILCSINEGVTNATKE